ncbi:hypothetical protein MNBD_GAMMA11-1431 [hydrothermal vent metagenome]|uniref:Uncharacterized protein n=1 Tax=hydrothermal vent metagenome TaxID=652676 RepID=A0A3B0WZR2_9ZZZZ
MIRAADNQYGIPYLAVRLFLMGLVLMIAASRPAFSAENVFKGRQKEQHELRGIELDRIKTEHRLKFGAKEARLVSYRSFRPWGRKNREQIQQEEKINWGECRDYALYKRNSCYRDGRDAYQCEQAYEVRFRLCDE